MYYSYVMGIDEDIYDLEKEGFIIKKDNDNFMISFNENMANEWEDFVYKHLKIEFWNEYITENEIVFIFHLKSGFKRYVVKNFKDDEVLRLCEKLCNCKFESIEKMIKDNKFYKEKIC